MFELERDETHHLQHVLRAREGDSVEIFDGEGHTVSSRISGISRHKISLSPDADIVTHPRLPCRVTLAQCTAKANRMNWIIEKAVELGAAEIVPVISQRTVVKQNREHTSGKVQRWQRIAVGAARQCNTAWLTHVMPPMPISEIKAPIPGGMAIVAALTTDTVPLKSILANPRPESLTALIGPEGDFTDEELRTVCQRGFTPVSLGPNVLRTETAGLYVISAVNCLWL